MTDTSRRTRDGGQNCLIARVPLTIGCGPRPGVRERTCPAGCLDKDFESVNFSLYVGETLISQTSN